MKKNYSYLVAVLIFSAALTSCKKKIDEFTVAFNSNGGSYVPSQIVKSGYKAIEPKVPIHTGYTFDSWYQETEFENKWNFETNVVTSNLTLHAKWIENEDVEDDDYKEVK